MRPQTDRTTYGLIKDSDAGIAPSFDLMPIKTLPFWMRIVADDDGTRIHHLNKVIG